MPASLVLAHLVREPNGPEPLNRFLDAYATHPAGIEHQLLLVLKGFASDDAAAGCLAKARKRGVDAHHLRISDAGVDLTAYAQVIAEVEAERYCFVNSFSRPLAVGWLGHLAHALDGPGVGLAGATGSWGSRQDYRRYHLGLRSGYADVFDDRERTRLGFLRLTRQRQPGKRDHGPIPFKAAAALDLLRDRDASDRFPAAHLRTNAFIVSRELTATLRLPEVRTKRAAYRLESGSSSLTRRVTDLGHRSVIVDRNGVLYDPDEWDASLTFWQASQPNLLVADNQTDDYERADAKGRRLLSALAWGSTALPG